MDNQKKSAKMVQDRIYECERSIEFVIRSVDNIFDADCYQNGLIPDILASMLKPIKDTMNNMGNELFRDLGIKDT